MSKFKTNKGLILKDGQKRLDISINVSHNKPLSNKRLIQLVKLLARQAAKEDYLQSILQSKGQGGNDENAR
jgi:hypothetical protein